MRGTKRERPVGSGVWEMRVTLGRDPLTGKRREKSRTFRGTERQAETALAKLVTETEQLGPHAAKKTFAALLEAWQEARKHRWEALTIERHRYGVENQILPALGDRHVSKLKTVDFESFYKAMLDSGLAPATVKRIHGMCSSAMNQAVRWEWIAKNPVAAVDPPWRDQKSGHRPLPEIEQVSKFLEIAVNDEPEWGRLFWCTLATGARRGEMAGLCRRAFDRSTNRLSIHQQVICLSGGRLVAKGVKRGDGRGVTLDELTAEMICSQLDETEQRAAKFGIVLSGDAYIWSDALDCSVPWRPDRITKKFIDLRNAAGIPGLRLHDLRHLNGTYLSNLGVDLATISYRLGHSRHSTTSDMYIGRVNSSEAAAAEVLAARLRSK